MKVGAGKSDGTSGDEGVIVEFHQVGNAVKVSAVDTHTYLEVSIVAPASATEREMTEAVLKKLAWVKSRGGGAKGGPKAPRGGR